MCEKGDSLVMIHMFGFLGFLLILGDCYFLSLGDLEFGRIWFLWLGNFYFHRLNLSVSTLTRQGIFFKISNIYDWSMIGDDELCGVLKGFLMCSLFYYLCFLCSKRLNLDCFRACGPGKLWGGVRRADIYVVDFIPVDTVLCYSE